MMPTILCVDDHPATLQSLSLIFRSVGYCCIAASNFEEAERAFAANHIDLVVLDHGLPGIDGSSLAVHLKRIRPVTVLMLSGSVELTDTPESVDLLLPKPQAPDALLAAIATLIPNSR
jgi:two-component system, OmpR family, KDP operon response regulator KdpE